MNWIVGVCLAGVLAAAPLRAQSGDAKSAPPAMDEQAMAEAFARMAAVGDNHKLLSGLVGEWTSVTKMWMAPGQPPQESTGTASNTLIMGGRYLQSVHKSVVMGMPFEGLGTTAYDNLTGSFVSTWVDNMSTGIFYQTGSYDAASRTFVYRGEMADPMAPAKRLPVRTTLRLVNADTYAFEWYESHDGHEARTLEVTYKRKK
jgi:hypothetical protein